MYVESRPTTAAVVGRGMFLIFLAVWTTTFVGGVNAERANGRSVRRGCRRLVGRENLLDVAPYIDDARALKLILLGGHTGAEVEGHDWEYLLNAMGLAYKDHAIAAVVQALASS